MLAIADVAVVVKDAKETARWWEEKLGFSVHTVGPERGHAITVAPPGDRYLIHLCEGFEPVDPGNTGIAFVTDDLETQVGRMVAAGVNFPEPMRTGSWGGRAKFADPDGNVFWLIAAPAEFIRRETALRAPAPRARVASAPRRARPTRGTARPRRGGSSRRGGR